MMIDDLLPLRFWHSVNLQGQNLNKGIENFLELCWENIKQSCLRIRGVQREKGVANL